MTYVYLSAMRPVAVKYKILMHYMTVGNIIIYGNDSVHQLLNFKQVWYKPHFDC
jgi:hypothetical protein